MNIDVWNPHEFSRLYNLHPWYWNSLLYGLISSGENSANFLQLMPFTIFHFFCSTRYPSRLGGQRQYGIRSLSNTPIHDQQWESNPRPSDLKSNALSTWPHAPIIHNPTACSNISLLLSINRESGPGTRRHLWRLHKITRL